MAAAALGSDWLWFLGPDLARRLGPLGRRRDPGGLRLRSRPANHLCHCRADAQSRVFRFCQHRNPPRHPSRFAGPRPPPRHSRGRSKLAPPPDLGTTRELLRLAGALPALLRENWRWQPWQARSGQPFAYHFTTMNNDGLRPAPHSQQPCFARMSRLLIDESLIHPIDCAIAHLGPLQIVFASHRRRRPGHAAALAPGRLPWHL